MIFPTVAVLAALASTAQAHFTLNAPLPRGVRVADDQLTFCGGHAEVTSNRTVFPLEGGNVNIQTGHGNWTAAVMVSTVANPNTFDAFKVDGEDVFVRQWGARDEHGGTFCLPLDLAAANLTDGANVTLQVVFEGGDGLLYQCADLTLSSNATAAGECKNATADDHHHGGNGTDDASDDDSDSDDSGSLRLVAASGIAAAAMGLLALAGAL